VICLGGGSARKLQPQSSTSSPLRLSHRPFAAPCRELHHARRGSSASDRTGAVVSARTDKPAAMAPVFDGGRCIGFLLCRGEVGFESFDIDEVSIGLFSNEADAAAAVWRRARGQLAEQEGAS
jgi:hypothetical protein